METKARIDPLTLPDIVGSIVPFLDKKRFLAQAAVVCKAWNQLYILILWRDMGTVRLGNNTILNFDLSVRYCGITLERLAPYLGTLAPKLKRLQLEAIAVNRRNELVSAIGVEPPHEEGGIDGGPPLEELRPMFSHYPGQVVTPALSLDTLVELLEARPGLKKIDLGNTSIINSATTTNNDHPLGSLEDVVMPTTMAMEELDGGRGLQNNRVVGTQSALTHLSLSCVYIDDKALVLLLEKTPRLNSLDIDSNHSLRGHFLDPLPTLCPELTHFSMDSCTSIPASAYSRFFWPSSEHRFLRLGYLT
ncbi:hypothetical protein BGX29_010591 [Mortierella sp. GBA35]|nr:hypothetical protein BGX29_010591 [Mortierella sp. GBA35]